MGTYGTEIVKDVVDSIQALTSKAGTQIEPS